MGRSLSAVAATFDDASLFPQSDDDGPDDDCVPAGGEDAPVVKTTLDRVLDMYEFCRRGREFALYGQAGYKVPRPKQGFVEKDGLLHFRRTAAALDDAGVQPETYIPRRFAVSPTRVVEPNQLLSCNAMEATGADLVNLLSSSTIIRDTLETSLVSQQASAETELALAEDPRFVLLDAHSPLTPLFRYILAEALGEDETAASLLPAAREQYSAAALEYDEAWAHILTPSVLEAVS